MMTVVGLGLFALGIICLSVRKLGEPDTRVFGHAQGWPPWPDCSDDEELFLGGTTELPDGSQTRPWSTL